MINWAWAVNFLIILWWIRTSEIILIQICVGHGKLFYLLNCNVNIRDLIARLTALFWLEFSAKHIRIFFSPSRTSFVKKKKIRTSSPERKGRETIKYKTLPFTLVHQNLTIINPYNPIFWWKKPEAAYFHHGKSCSPSQGQPNVRGGNKQPSVMQGLLEHLAVDVVLWLHCFSGGCSSKLFLYLAVYFHKLSWRMRRMLHRATVGALTPQSAGTCM